MMNEKIFANEILLDEELEKVSGGTVEELDQIMRAFFSSNPDGPSKEIITGMTAHCPGPNILTAEYIESFMKNEMKIDAHISIGVGGLGVFSKKNTYQDLKTGKFISHDEVLKRAVNHAL